MPSPACRTRPTLSSPIRRPRAAEHTDINPADWFPAGYLDELASYGLPEYDVRAILNSTVGGPAPSTVLAWAINRGGFGNLALQTTATVKLDGVHLGVSRSISIGGGPSTSASCRVQRATTPIEARENITRTFPEITAAHPEAVAGRPVILDGEVVALDKNGAPSFGRLRRRWRVRANRRAASRDLTVRFSLIDILCRRRP